MRGVVDTAVTREPSFGEIVEALSLGLPYRLCVSADGRDVRVLHLGGDTRSMLGVPAEAILENARVFASLILPEDRPILRAASTAAVAERRPFFTEVRMRGPDGDVRWRSIRAAPQVLADGSTLWDGLVSDITESKRLAEQLTEERRRLELTIELTGAGSFTWDRDDPQTVLWSDRQYDIYGVPPETPMTVQAFRNLIHPEDRGSAWLARRWAADAPDEADQSGEYRIVRPDGEVRWVLSHQRVRRDALGVRSIHGTTLDITDRRNAEEHRRLQVRELAHRAKNAMAVMIAMVQQAARGAGDAEELKQVLVARLTAMAHSQDLAAETDGGPLPLPALLKRALEAFDLSRFELDPALAGVVIPGEAVIPMALLLHELATNSVKYGACSKDGGRVRLSPAPAAHGRIAVEWREIDGPPVEPPTRPGFGMRLLSAALQGVGGGVHPEFAPDGFRALMEMPAVAV